VKADDRWNFTPRLVLILLVVFCSMVHQVSYLELRETRRVRLIHRYRKDNVSQGCRQRHQSIFHSSGRIRVCAEVSRRGEPSVTQSLERKLTRRDHEWYETSSVSHVRTRPVSSLSMKSMPSLRNDSMLRQDQIGKYSVFSSNSLIKWTVSISKLQSRSALSSSEQRR
jgi:hypothetical protein